MRALSTPGAGAVTLHPSAYGHSTRAGRRWLCVESHTAAAHQPAHPPPRTSNQCILCSRGRHTQEVPVTVALALAVVAGLLDPAARPVRQGRPILPPFPQRCAPATGRAHPGWRVARTTPASRLDLGAATPAHLALGPRRGHCLYRTQVGVKAREEAPVVGVTPTPEYHPAKGDRVAHTPPPTRSGGGHSQSSQRPGGGARWRDEHGGGVGGALVSGRGVVHLRTR